MATVPASVNRPLARDRLFEQIVEQVGQRIVSGEYAPGERLPSEPVLAAQYGVSKPAVREAMKILAAKRLISIHQGRGTFVNPRDDWNVLDQFILAATMPVVALRHLVEVRRHFEPEIAALAAERATRADLEWMREVLDHASQRLDLEEHVRWDTAFHQALARATGNPVYEIIMNSMGELLVESRRRLFGVDGAAERAYHHHAAIFAGVENEDAEEARRAMLHHIDQVASEVGRL
jgi:GntR family galactonate operon transcriptional repressor